MITYNKEQGAWDFREATEDEKDQLMTLAEAMFASAMANAMAQKWVQEEQEAYEKAEAEMKAMKEKGTVIEFPVKH